jgi:hypothetical protein
MHLNETSIYTTPLKFDASAFPIESEPAAQDPEPIPAPEDDGAENGPEDQTEVEKGDGSIEDTPSLPWELNDRRARGKRQWDLIEGITNGLKSSSAQDDNDDQGGDGGGAVYEVPAYTGPVHYPVPKTGYYCVGMSFSTSIVTRTRNLEADKIGIVPVTLLNERSTQGMEPRQANHAEYSGLVLFKSTFEGELPAAEYPKINVCLLYTSFLHDLCYDIGVEGADE